MAKKVTNGELTVMGLWPRLDEYVFSRDLGKVFYKKRLLHNAPIDGKFVAKKVDLLWQKLASVIHKHFHVARGPHVARQLHMHSLVNILEGSPYEVYSGNNGLSGLLEEVGVRIATLQRWRRLNLMPIPICLDLISQAYRRHHICGGGVWLALDKTVTHADSWLYTTLVACVWARRRWSVLVLCFRLPSAVTQILRHIYEVTEDQVLQHYPRIVHYEIPRLLAYILLNYQKIYQRRLKHAPVWLQDLLTAWEQNNNHGVRGRYPWWQRRNVSRKAAYLTPRRVYDAQGNLFWSCYAATEGLPCLILHPLLSQAETWDLVAYGIVDVIRPWRWPVDNIVRRAAMTGRLRFDLVNFFKKVGKHSVSDDELPGILAAVTKHFKNDEELTTNLIGLINL